jgi:hypothetical protein
MVEVVAELEMPVELAEEEMARLAVAVEDHSQPVYPVGLRYMQDKGQEAEILFLEAVQILAAVAVVALLKLGEMEVALVLAAKAVTVYLHLFLDQLCFMVEAVAAVLKVGLADQMA